MALEILWTRRADKKFDLVIEYLMREWGERVTKSFVKNVYDLIEVLAEFPEIGAIEFKEKEVRCFTIVKQINIFYRVKDNKIIILNFFDNRQSPQKKRF